MTLLFATGGTLSIGAAYWITMLILLIFGFWFNWPATPANWRPLGFNLVIWLLFFLLGWSEFGFPVGGR